MATMIGNLVRGGRPWKHIQRWTVLKADQARQHGTLTQAMVADNYHLCQVGDGVGVQFWTSRPQTPGQPYNKRRRATTRPRQPARCMAGAATPRKSAMRASEGAIPRERSAARSLRRPGRILAAQHMLAASSQPKLDGQCPTRPCGVSSHVHVLPNDGAVARGSTCNGSASCVDAFTQSTAIVTKTRQCAFTDGHARLWSRPRHCPVRSLNQPSSWSARPREQKSRRHRRRRPRRLSGVRRCPHPRAAGTASS